MGKYSLVRHKGTLDSNLLKLLDEEIEKKSGLEPKINGVISSVPIAAAVTAYARIALSKFLNIKNNECVYTDTDSIILRNPLPKEYIGPEIGKMKLEHKIIEGIFISPKTYALSTLDKNGYIIKIFKAKGVGSQLMTYDMYKRLYKGESVTINKKYFLQNIEGGTVNIVDRDYTIKGVVNPIVYNNCVHDIVKKINEVKSVNNLSLTVIDHSNLSVVVYKYPVLSLIISTARLYSVIIYHDIQPKINL